MASEHLDLQIHTAEIPQEEKKRPKRMRMKARLSFQDRLLRNSFLACAVLLGILALGNVEAPWATKAADGIKQALTMKVDLDESLGQLTFVQKMMPESALVFFNLNGGSEFAQPVDANLVHIYDAMQPWLMYACEPGSRVSAPGEGTVSAISPLSDGSWGVLIDHGEGLESVLAGLEDVCVQVGAKVVRGGEIGAACESLYYELRQGGAAIDPAEHLGL